MANEFTVNYNSGGVVDKVKNLKNVEVVNKIEAMDSLGSVENVNEINNLKNIENIDKIGGIKGFATKTQPYNFMRVFDIPALAEDFEFEVELPAVECEVLALTVTCSGYGEDDNYDLFFNSKQWFKNWYCSEVKEGLFLGTSTYVYSAPAHSIIRFTFHNVSGTAKKVWLGIRTLIDIK